MFQNNLVYVIDHVLWIMQGENKALEMAVQYQKKQLMERQQLELQKQHVKEMLEIEKSNETDKDRIAELESELEGIQEMSNALVLKEREANDQLEEARKAACQVNCSLWRCSRILLF